MSHITIVLFGWVFLLFTASCEDFLDLNPISEQNVDDFYQNANDIKTAVNGAYQSLHLVYNNYYFFGEVRSDNTTIQTFVINNADIDEFSISTSNINTAQIWESCYTGISRVNTTLGRIGGIEMEDELRSRYVGELKYLRGFLYFQLARIFGGVPLILEEVNDPKEGFDHSRASLDDVYLQIEQDLDDAVGSLPASYDAENMGRATSGAARALLAKVHLAQGENQQAIPLLEAVMESETYELLPAYEDVFDINNANNPEILFSVRYEGGGTGTGSPFNNLFAPKAAGEIITQLGQANGQNVPEQSLLDAYEEDDQRFDATISMGFTNAEDEYVEDPFTTKFLDQGMTAPFDASNDWPVIRYSDVLLMYAEALGESDDAYEAINRVRTRAGLPDIDETSPGTFTEKLLQERRVELAFEGHRWFDLVRLDQFIPVMNAEGTVPYEKGNLVQEYHRVFPIPQSEIDVNPNLEQNNGYTF